LAWLHTRRTERGHGSHTQRTHEELVVEVRTRWQLEERYRALDIDIAGDIQDQEGTSLHTYLVRYCEASPTEFPALDPRLDAPDGEDAWDENDLSIRERAPSMDAECIRAWLGGLQVYGEVERSKAYIQGYARIHSRARIPVRLAEVPHTNPAHEDLFRVWFRARIPASLKVQTYAVTVCLLCSKAEDERHVLKVERGVCDCPAGAGGHFGGCLHVSAALWLFHHYQRPQQPCTSLESSWYGESGTVEAPRRATSLSKVDFNRHVPGKSKKRRRVNSQVEDVHVALSEDPAKAMRDVMSSGASSDLFQQFFKEWINAKGVKCTLHAVTEAYAASTRS
jgi:hypothetical protein